MYGHQVRLLALQLHAAGATIAAIHRSLGVSRAAIRDWTLNPSAALAQRERTSCFACAGELCSQPTIYAYLLGQYLGDGYISPTRVPRLRVACADTYPGIAAEVDSAMHALSGNRVSAVAGVGYSDRGSYWNHWPCLFPQHGPGRKHQRPIVLAGWQEAIVAEHPWPLIRGLIHSDGCRAMNRIVTRGKRYAYPRYFFANESTDILSIMGITLDRVGVQWRFNRPNSISVARRTSVGLMDDHIGPKT